MSAKNKGSKNNKKRNTKKSIKTSQQNYFVSVAALAFSTILTALFIYLPNTGVLSTVIKETFLSMFSVGAYLIPVVLGGLCVYVAKQKNTKKLGIKSVLCVVGIVLISSVYHIFTGSNIPYDSLFLYAHSLTGGGIIGGIIAKLLSSLFGDIATVVILIFLFIINLSILIKISVFGLFGSFVSGLLEIRDEIDDIDHHDLYENGKSFKKRIEKSSLEQRKSKKQCIDFSIDSDDEKTTQSDNKTEENIPQKSKISKKDLQLRIDEIVFKPDIPLTDNTDAEDEENITLGASLDDVETTEDLGDDKTKEKPKRVENVSEAEKQQISGEIEDSIENTKIEYIFPPINLLKKAPTTSADKRREMQETASKLMEILKNFGVDAKLLQVTQGPSVTRYEIQPSTGVKLSKITGLAEDIALNLAVDTVLVAAVPGKAAVGIEVPNTNVNTVCVRELLESPKFTDATSKLTVALGKDIGGNVVVGDISKMPHVLIAGSTGSGKSVCINTIITSILYKASPDEVKLIMVDPKVVELGVYNGIPHLLIPVVTDPKRAAGALNWAVGEMMRRYSLFAQTGSRNLSGYNELMAKNNEEKLPQIVIIIDELADLMMVAAKEVEDYVCRLAQLARAAGIHLIIATQRPSVDVITGLIKANVPSRIAFAVSSQVDSRTILDKGGAEKLLGKGDMLYHPTGLSSALRVQGAFVSDNEIESIVNFIKENSEVTHYSDDLAEHLDKIASGDISSEESKEDDDADELLPEAIELAVELGQISTAMIQRRLKVGYARAGRIIDQMEFRGIISGANGSKPREVYMNRINMTDFDAN